MNLPLARNWDRTKSLPCRARVVWVKCIAPRLKPDVALKILPQAFCPDADRLRRFEQEALATAALHHRNLLAVSRILRPETCAYCLPARTAGSRCSDWIEVAASLG